MSRADLRRYVAIPSSATRLRYTMGHGSKLTIRGGNRSLGWLFGTGGRLLAPAPDLVW